MPPAPSHRENSAIDYHLFVLTPNHATVPTELDGHLMWTPTTRAQHRRDGLRFASDTTDAEWAVLRPLLPPPSPRGRTPEWPLRDIVDAIFYVLRGGIPWRMLPTCFPPHQTVYGWFARWRWRV
ncbi:protein of unknown function (plasmid) [Rhodovastum atsumiense]|nr:protein of unknown function [Rhodovastum atsumiense]